MHAASVALLLHGVLVASLVGLVIRANFSAETLLLIGLLLNIHPRLLSYIQISSSSVQELPYSGDDIYGFAVIREEQMQRGSPQSKDCVRVPSQVIATVCLTERQPRQSGEENPLSSIIVPAETPNCESSNTVLSNESMEADSPTKSYIARCKGRQSTRKRGTIDGDKENEPSLLKGVTPRVADPLVSRHNGLRAFTLTNLPLLDVKHTVTPQRGTTLCSGAKRLSPLFYVSDSRQQQSHPAPSSGEKYPRRVSLPPNCFSRTGLEVRLRMQDDTQLSSRLKEEMKLTERLRNDFVELRDQACAELNQSKHQAQALAVAVDVQERFIKDLAASMELLRVENKVLKKESRREMCYNDVTRTNVNKDVQHLSPVITTEELKKEKPEVPNIKAQRFWGLSSVQRKNIGQHSFKRVGTALRCVTGIGEPEENSFCKDTTDLFSMGSVSEPTLEPRGGRVQSFPTPSPADNAELNEYTEPTLEVMEVQFPSISPEFPPCRAFGPSKAVHSSSGDVIYQIDGRGFAASHERPSLPWRSPHSGGDHVEATRPRDTSMRMTTNEACYGEGSCLAMQEDSPFYGVPVSAFIMPRVVISPLSA